VPLSLPRLYLITDRHQVPDGDLTGCLAAALSAGARLVQLREKDLPTRDLLALARQVKSLCDRHGARLLINDRADVALRVACGVHLTSVHPPVAEVRGLLGPGALIGVSTHSAAEMAHAAGGGADFVTLGPVFDTPSKRGMGTPLGLSALHDAACGSALPVFALGGIKVDQIGCILASRVHGVALISAVMAADDPAAATADLIAATNSSKT